MKQLDRIIDRLIDVDGIDQPVAAAVGPNGISLRIAGTKISVRVSWKEVIAAGHTPGNVPAFLEGKPFEFLKYQGKKTAGRKFKKNLKKVDEKGAGGGDEGEGEYESPESWDPEKSSSVGD